MAHWFDNLDNIGVNDLPNGEIVHIIRESNAQIGRTFDSGRGNIKLAMFPKFCATVDYRSLESHSLRTVYISCENQFQKQLASCEFHPIWGFLH
jgi:hypothetical protein